MLEVNGQRGDGLLPGLLISVYLTQSVDSDQKPNFRGGSALLKSRAIGGTTILAAPRCSCAISLIARSVPITIHFGESPSDPARRSFRVWLEEPG